MFSLIIVLLKLPFFNQRFSINSFFFVKSLIILQDLPFYLIFKLSEGYDKVSQFIIFLLIVFYRHRILIEQDKLS